MLNVSGLQRRLMASVVLAIGFTVATGGDAVGAPLFFEDFNGLSGPIPGVQVNTGLPLQAGANLAGWSKTGAFAFHSVDRTGSGDWALQMLGSAGPSNSVATMLSGFAANTNGVPYLVSFEFGPSVFQTFSERTVAGDQFLIELLNPLNTVVASHLVSPNPWPGDPLSQTLFPGSFTYVGDGTGDVRFRLSSVVTFSRNHFYGAIDNLQVSAVPEPMSLASWLLLAMIGVGFGCWRKR